MKHYILFSLFAFISIFAASAGECSKLEQKDSHQKHEKTTAKKRVYWISYADHMTHNEGCRCYGREDGYFCTKSSGKNCPFCGGAER